VGVLNALSETGDSDLVAGSSVGSVIAAMVAQVLTDEPKRRGRIARLAATFMRHPIVSC
jgi:predicted acylesterase/phospholipase RssA